MNPGPQTGRGFRAPLGRYTVSERKLNDDVLQLRTQKGGVVHRFPTEKLPSKVGEALRKIVHGGSLTFDDIEGLSEDERRFMHRLGNQCDCMDRVNIPAPKKDAEAKMADDFTKYRGEILAGNDAPELVRKFKTLLLKMATLELLPKSQVREICVDLLSLGH